VLGASGNWAGVVACAEETLAAVAERTSEQRRAGSLRFANVISGIRLLRSGGQGKVGTQE
jgi:hypothetical protein